MVLDDMLALILGVYLMFFVFLWGLEVVMTLQARRAGGVFSCLGQSVASVCHVMRIPRLACDVLYAFLFESLSVDMSPRFCLHIIDSIQLYYVIS